MLRQSLMDYLQPLCIIQEHVEIIAIRHGVELQLCRGINSEKFGFSSDPCDGKTTIKTYKAQTNEEGN